MEKDLFDIRFEKVIANTPENFSRSVLKEK